MSVSISYYSFSPSRADQGWKFFIEDITAINDHEKIPWEEKKLKVTQTFQPKIDAVLQEIFSFFDTKGFIIPGIEWDKEEGVKKDGTSFHLDNEMKIAYLLDFGRTYPRTTDLNTVDFTKDQIPFMLLEKDAPELLEKYQQVLMDRSKTIDEVLRGTSSMIIKGVGPTLNERQQRLYNNDCLGRLDDSESSKKETLQALMFIDVMYGSVVNDYFEDPKLEYACLEGLVAAYDLKVEENFPTKESWLYLFQNLNPDGIKAAAIKADIPVGVIADYLYAIRPVIKDLRETPDTQCLSIFNGEGFTPPSAVQFLMKRAEEHYKTFKGKIPSIW